MHGAVPEGPRGGGGQMGREAVESSSRAWSLEGRDERSSVRCAAPFRFPKPFRSTRKAETARLCQFVRGTYFRDMSRRVVFQKQRGKSTRKGEYDATITAVSDPSRSPSPLENLASLRQR